MQISVSPQDKLTAFNCRYLNCVLVSGETRLLVTVPVCLQVLTTYHEKTCLADMKKTCILLQKNWSLSHVHVLPMPLTMKNFTGFKIMKMKGQINGY
jgi:hypothetical protein